MKKLETAVYDAKGKMLKMAYQKERKLSTDIVIIGGGPAGSVAAIAAARHGASTLLIEQYGYLGGMLTTAGTGPQMSYHAGKTQVVRGIAEEIVNRLKAENLSPGHMEDFAGFASSVTPFDPEGMKRVLEDMVLESGAQILYHTVYTGCELDGNRISSVRLFSKCGFFDASGRVFIDCSADGDLSTHSGVAFDMGDEKDGSCQPMTMNIRLGNVDRDKVIEYVMNNWEDMRPTVPFEHLKVIPRTGIQGAWNPVEEAKKNGEFHIGRKDVLCFETNNPGEFIINMSRIPDLSAIDPFALTKAEIEGRRQAVEIAAFLKKYIPGFENSYIISTGPNIGIRESRRIRGLYRITGEDLVSNKMFDDAVLMGGYPVDVHSKHDSFPNEKYRLTEGSWYSMPYRCMVTDQVDNLIVAGRCISADRAACGALRVTPLVMAMGQAAGTAAVQSLKEKVSTGKIDTERLRDTLIKDGVFLEPYRT